MTEKIRSHRRQDVIWGLLLIVLGVLYMLDQMRFADLGRLWSWWPAALIIIGVGRLALPDTPRQRISGVSFILFGFWFFACIRHWYGLTFGRGWPLVLVIFGIETMLAALLERREPTAVGKEESHV